MAIADTITSMQTHTSNAYDMLEYGTDLTGINKNLQNLSTSIFKAFIESLNNPDTLWGNLPKITGTGTNISLNDTIQAPMKIEYNPSELTQEGTPTPSSPQPIHTISGNNTIKVENKNFISSIEKNGNRLFFNGKQETDYQFKAGTYTFSYTKNISSNIGVFYRTATTSSTNLGSETTITITSNEDFNIWFYRSGMELTDVSNVQLEKGSSATTYEPHQENTYPINLGDIELGTMPNTDYKNEFVRSDGENLFNGNNVSTTNTTNWTISFNNEILSITHNNSYTTGTPILNLGVLPNGTYILSGTLGANIGLRRNDIYSTMLSNGSTFTCDGTESIAFTFGADANTTNTYKQVMLNKGTTALPYVPYEKGWYIKKNIGKVVLDGTENWSKQTNYYQCTTNFGAIGGYGLCNYYSYGSTSIPNSFWTTTNAFRTNDTTDTLENYKTWLSTHNIILYYIMATPTYTKITGELANQLEQVNRGMLSYDGTTNISQVNNDLAFELVGSALEDLR